MAVLESLPVARFSHLVPDVAALRALYHEPSELIRNKKVNRIDDLSRQYIEGSPFCLVATADAHGHCDVSPRGGPPGFIRVLDDTGLAIPDLTGNNLLDSLTNIVANPHVGLLFIIPGRDETLRVEGEAWLTTDPNLLALWDDELRPPRVVIGVEINALYTHCAKSFRRGRVWDSASWGALTAPDTCDRSLMIPVVALHRRTARDATYLRTPARLRADSSRRRGLAPSFGSFTR
jgi:PPOX class probable FMN-dependent enzyme